MKPRWEDSPDWANWLAQDKDGRWMWYDAKPDQDFDCWVASHKGEFVEFAYIEEWQVTLEGRP